MKTVVEEEAKMNLSSPPFLSEEEQEWVGLESCE